MLGRRASLKGELARLPGSTSREIKFQTPAKSDYQIKKVKLPCLMSHPAFACGIIYGQSAMKQLQKLKELHHEEKKHLSEQKSRTT